MITVFECDKHLSGHFCWYYHEFYPGSTSIDDILTHNQYSAIIDNKNPNFYDPNQQI